MYELGCCRSLALVKGEGKASGACTGRACADGAYADRAYVGKACVDRAYVDGAYTDGACIGGACVDGAFVDGAAYWGVGVIGGWGVLGVVASGRNLKRRLIAYKLKGPSLSIYSLIFASNYSV